ncbi:MAG: hypothetical protein QW795_03570 [Candidatus Bathyarchaeia archaeon]
MKFLITFQKERKKEIAEELRNLKKDFENFYKKAEFLIKRFKDVDLSIKINYKLISENQAELEIISGLEPYFKPEKIIESLKKKFKNVEVELVPLR